MKPWKRIEPTISQQVGRRVVVTKTFREPNGITQTFDTYGPERQQHAGVVAITPDLQVLVARQFRAGPQMIMEEIPGGTVEVGEDPIVAAERELLEETGYKGHMQPLGVCHKDAYMNATWHYFLATDCVHVAEQQLDDVERVELRLISIDHFLENALHDRMSDHAAVLFAYEFLQKLKGETT